MNKGDIVLYKPRENRRFYGVVKYRAALKGFAVDVLTDPNRQQWAVSVTCHIDKLEVVEAYETL